MVALAVAIIMFGLMAMTGSPPGAYEPPEWLEEGGVWTVSGRVYDVQERTYTSAAEVWIYLDSITILQYNNSRGEVPFSYKIICRCIGQERPPIGSTVQVTGHFQTFSKATNPGQFDAASYYRTLNIGGTIEGAEILSVEGQGSFIREKLYCLKARFKEKLYNHLPKREASVMCAMLLGDKTGLDEELEKLYQRNGIVHILSISGLHITMIGMSIYKLLHKCGCPPGLSAGCSSVLLLLYGAMTGMGVSTTRAIGMYLLRMLGLLLGRTYDMLTALAVMSLCLLCTQPLYLENSGFLLSFGSICGIGMLLPLFQAEEETPYILRTGWRKYVKAAWNAVRNALLPGLCVTVFTLPVQLKLFYQVPVYSVLLNLLILPLVGILMSAGLAALLLPGGAVFGYVGVWVLKIYERLCLLFETLPGHTWSPGAPKVWQIAGYYLLLFGALAVGMGSMKRKLKGGKIMAVRVMVLILAVALLGVRAPLTVQVTFLDVGQGDCAVVQTGEEDYLFDCGGSGRVGENILLPFLKYAGIDSLEAVFVSHPDKDHVSGILELLAAQSGEKDTAAAGVSVKKLVLADIAAAGRREEYGALLTAAAAAQVPVFYMAAGASWQSGKTMFTCLHPEGNTRETDSNEASMCFLVETGAFSMLLTGDVEGEGEDALALRYRQLRGGAALSVLKVAHHGSRNSSDAAFLELVRPYLAVISCGEDNAYGHPHRELLDRLEAVGSKLYATSQTGAVTLKVWGDKLRVETFCE